MFERHPGNPILSKDISNQWEERAVLNPCVQEDEDRIRMLYRTLSSEGIIRPNGKEYHYSHIGYAESQNGVDFKRRSRPFISPEESWENLGCEDPRFVKIDSINYIFYTAVSQTHDNDINVQIAGASTKDFKSVEKLGVVALDGRCKAASLFPEKINGKFVFLYTQDADSSKSEIKYAEVENISDLFNKKKWENTKKISLLHSSIGAYRGPELGAPPIKTAKGWLLIYCPESFKREWFIGAALLDLKDPKKIISRTSKPILKPEKEYELNGYVSNVTFPEGAIIKDGKLYVYYGGADQGVCLATCDLDKLLSSLS